MSVKVVSFTSPSQYMVDDSILEEIFVKEIFVLVEKLSFMTILCHFGRVILNTSHQFGCIIPNIHITLDIFSHFEQCHKRPCFLLVLAVTL